MRKSDFAMTIEPEFLYSVGQAARYFGVHRCTVYAYVANREKPLPHLISERNGRIIFLGQTLIEYKLNGLPKKGLKRKNTPRGGFANESDKD